MKTLLILNGNDEGRLLCLKAKHMGLKTIVVDNNLGSPARDICDWFIRASIYDEDEVLAKCWAGGFDGVITVAADCTKSVAALAKYHDLPGPSMGTAIASTDKVIMRQMLKQGSIPQPKYMVLVDGIRYARFFPGVMKPHNSRGARGVAVYQDDKSLIEANNIARQFSSIVIEEEWIEGPQLSVEAIVWAGFVHICGIADRNYNLPETYPHVIESGGVTPSIFTKAVIEGLHVKLSCCADAIGLKNGTIKADIVYNAGELYVIEVAARLSGGYFSMRTIPEVYGYDLPKNAIKVALGEKPEYPSDILNTDKKMVQRFEVPEGCTNHTERGKMTMELT